MTRTEYIAKLTKYLRKLPQKDYEEALEYFMEYFEEAGPENEAQVIAELGTPKEAAHEVISLSLIHISEPTRPPYLSRMPSSA